jgi:phosphatidylcholine synthase
MDVNKRIGKIGSWSIHLFTASGAVLGFFALVSIARGDLGTATLLMLAALAIDGVDGTLARAARVAERAPEINGRRLDDIVDYLNFVIAPVFFLWGAGSLLHPVWLAGPILASAFGFSRENAKTDDDFFLGFPSYWNVLAIYLWLLDIGPVGGTIWVAVLSIAVFIPFKYLYPTKVKPISLRFGLAVGALAWTAALVACVRWPDATRALFVAELSLLYPAWYMWLSITRGGFLRTALPGSAGSYE